MFPVSLLFYLKEIWSFFGPLLLSLLLCRAFLKLWQFYLDSYMNVMQLNTFKGVGWKREMPFFTEECQLLNAMKIIGIEKSPFYKQRSKARIINAC